MSEKTGKAKKGRAAARKDNAGVLGNLPATRTSRFGGERAERSSSASKPAAAAAKPRATAAKPRPKAAPTPKAAAPRSAKVTTTERARRTPATPAREPRPRPVRAGAPALAESTDRARSEASEPREPGASPPTGTELVTTAIQAAGELAQIGLTVGGQVLRRALRRPR